MKKNVTQDLFFERNVTQKKRHTVAKKKKKWKKKLLRDITNHRHIRSFFFWSNVT